MPVVTFTVRRGLSASEKTTLSQAMLEAQVAAGFAKNDLFHRFLEVAPGDLLVDARYPAYEADRTERFVLVEVIISADRPPAVAKTMADEAVRLLGERLGLAPQDILFLFQGNDPTSPRFPGQSNGGPGHA
ncbi:tautomerase family protein [Acidisphaera sp. L21]|uniref:tautomerase family protein n=1 Tax=Acidisphaera sp. L21 TaxID=1641851 RepID=UPI00131AD5D4|nr:tautomerase family protein [Acidisphaera sp. L21]